MKTGRVRLQVGHGNDGVFAWSMQRGRLAGDPGVPRDSRITCGLTVALAVTLLGLAFAWGSVSAQEIPPEAALSEARPDAASEAGPAVTEEVSAGAEAPGPDEAFRAEIVDDAGGVRRLERDADLRTVARQGAVTLRAESSLAGGEAIEVLIDARASELLARLGVVQAGDLVTADPARVARALRLDVADWIRLRQAYADVLQ